MPFFLLEIIIKTHWFLFSHSNVFLCFRIYQEAKAGSNLGLWHREDFSSFCIYKASRCGINNFQTVLVQPLSYCIGKRCIFFNLNKMLLILISFHPYSVCHPHYKIYWWWKLPFRSWQKHLLWFLVSFILWTSLPSQNATALSSPINNYW